MVHADDAAIAAAAMVGARRLICIAFHAEEKLLLLGTTRAVGCVGRNGSGIRKGTFASPCFIQTHIENATERP